MPCRTLFETVGGFLKTACPQFGAITSERPAQTSNNVPSLHSFVVHMAAQSSNLAYSAFGGVTAGLFADLEGKAAPDYSATHVLCISTSTHEIILHHTSLQHF
jgi:hypothetical protein